jgi:hypothetical protein
MIVYDLQCHKNHVFEAWFASSGAFDRQAKAGAVVCPVCGSKKVSKALMAPAVSGTRTRDDKAPATAGEGPPDTARVGMYMNALKELRQHVEQSCDYVGEKFPEEARKMHYGEADKRNIYGEASETEAEKLRDEGVTFERIPWAPTHDA